MSISALSQLKSRTINSIYQQKGSDNKFSLNSSSVEKEIKKLEEKMKHGQISQKEFEREKKALESLPQTLYTTDGDNNLKSSNASQIDNKETQYEINSIEKKHSLGDMSDFAYKANMHLLTTPIPEQENLVGQRLSLYA